MARAGRLLLWGLGVLSTLVVCGALALSLPATQRALAHWGLRQLDAVLVGSLRAGKVHALTPWRVHLSEIVVREASGRTVAEVAELDVRVAPWALLRRTLHLREVHIERPEAELGSLNEADEALLGALRPSATFRDQGPSDADFPIAIRIDRLTVAEARASGHLNGRALSAVAPVIQASGRYADVPALAVQALRLRVQHGERTLLALQGKEADWSHEKGGRAELTGEVAGNPLTLVIESEGPAAGLDVRLRVQGGEGVAELEARWRRDALEMRLDAHRLHLASLHDALPELKVHGRFQASAKAPFTTPHATAVRWSNVRVQARAVPDGQAELSYRAPDLRVGDLRLGEDGALRGSARLRTDPLSAELSLQGSGVEMAALVPEVPLQATADLDLHATRDAAGAIEVRFEVAAGKLRVPGARLAGLEISGKATASADNELRGEVTGRYDALGAAEVQIGQGSLEANLAGRLEAPRFDALLRARDARLGPMPSAQLSLSISGNLRQAFVELQADWHPRYALHVRSEVRRVDGAVELDAEGLARVDGRRWKLHAQGIDLRWQPALRLRVGALRLQQGAQRVVLRGTLDDDRVRARLAVRELDLGGVPRAGAGGPALSGRVERAVLQASGRLRSPSASLSARIRDLAMDDSPALNGEVVVELDPAQARAEAHVDLRAQNGEARLTSDLRTQWGTKRTWPGLADLERGRHAVELKACEVDLAVLRPYLPAGLPGMQGVAGADLQAEGTLDSLRGKGWVGVTLRATGQPEAQRLRVSVDLDSQRSQLRLVARQGWKPLVRASAQWPEPVRALVERTDTPLALLSEDFEVEVQLRSQRLDRLQGSFGRWLKLARLELPVRTSGSLSVRGEGEHIEGQGRVRVVMKSRAFDANCGLKAQSSLDAELSLSRRRLSASLLARTGSGKVDARGRMPFDLHAFARDGSGIGAARLDAQASRVALHELPGLCGLTQGHASAEISASDLGGRTPQVEGSVRFRSLQLRDEPPTSLSASLAGNRTRVQVDGTIEVDAKPAGEFDLTLPLAPDPWPMALDMDAPLHARLRLQGVPPASLLSTVDAVGQVDGSLSADLRLEGTLEDPQPSGTVDLEELDFSVAAIAQPFHDVTGRIRIENRRLQIEDLRVRDRDGRARVDGNATYHANGSVDADLQVEVEELPVRRNGAIVAEANTELDAHLAVSPEGAMDLDLVVRGGRVWLTGARGDQVMDLAPMVEVHFASGDRPEVQQAREPPWSLDTLQLRTSDESLWVMHKDFSVQVGIDMRVQGGEAVSITGAVELIRGELNLLGNAFRVQEGEIRFTGSTPPAPQLEIAAVHAMPAGEDLRVSVTGRATAPELTFSGAADTAGGAVAAMTGFGSAGAEGQAQSQASDFAINLMAGVLSVTARRELGDWVPLLSVDSNTEGIQRLRAGFDASHLIPDPVRDVARGLYIEGIVGEGQSATGDDAPLTGLGVGVSAEVAFPHDIVTSGRYGPGSTWSADVGWSP